METHESFIRGTLDTRLSLGKFEMPRIPDHDSIGSAPETNWFVPRLLASFPRHESRVEHGCTQWPPTTRPPHEPHSGALAIVGAKEWFVHEFPQGASRSTMYSW